VPFTIGRSFSGFAMKYDKWRDQAAALGAALEKDGLLFYKEMYWTAGYDAPFKVFNRHNEVWFVPKNSQMITMK